MKKRSAARSRSRRPSARPLSSPADKSGPAGLLAFQRDELMPAASATVPAVHLKSPTPQPQIYRRRIERAEDARPGDLVAVYAGQSEPLGYGLYNPRSELTLRMMWHGPQYPEPAAWQDRLLRAVQLRRDVLRLDNITNACRLIHAESDELPGLIVDHYAGVLSAEVFSLAMYQRAALLMPQLAAVSGAAHWIVRTAPQFLSQEGCDPPGLKSEGCPDSVVITEHGTRYRIPLASGHKTGFFCDQRNNRRRLAEFCQGRSVLDLCCYTGGFSVHAAHQGQAAEATGVDLDEEPLLIAKQNANLNQTRVRFVQADAFAWMREMIRNGRQYDVVVLDPPKLIRTRMEIEDGTKRHFALNRLAFQLVRPGGLLLTCSCAGLLPETDFVKLVIGASRSTPEPDASDDIKACYRPGGRTVRILARTGAAPDHPVIGNCPETEYLKAVWMIVD